jgi:two-component sensor histidine kinase
MPNDQARPIEVPPARPRRRWQAIDLLLVASLLLPALAFAAIAAQDRRQTLAAGRQDLLATLDTLHGHAAKVLEFQALALGAAEEWLRGRDAEDVRREMAHHHVYLAALRRHANQALGLVVFDPAGRPLVESDRPSPPEVEVGDREYFAWHRDHADAGTRIAGPVRSRAGEGAAVFFLTRRWSGPDGSFQGVLAAGLRQDSLISQWNRAAPDQDALVALVREDGTVLAHRPAVDPEAFPRLPETSPLRDAIASGAEREIGAVVSSVDGRRRLSALRRLEGLPVHIGYAVPEASILAPWRQRLALYGAFAVAVAAGLFLLALLARRRSRELDALAATLEQRVCERTAEIQAGESRLRFLAREVDHRAKNALAVVQATLRLTPKGDVESYARAVEGRVSALARAQTLLAEDRWRGAALRALLESELAAFVTPARGGTPRLRLAGPDVLLPPEAAQPLAMMVHELATNAVKHGALSTPEGRVEVGWTVGRDGALSLRWAESGGPAVEGPPSRRGFGSRVVESVVRNQLGGRLEMRWREHGLACDIAVPLSRFAARAEEVAPPA